MSILITGCSTGIGYAAGKRLKQQGYDVIASARNIEHLASLEKEGIKTICLDLNSSESIAEATKKAFAMTNEGIDVLINNAGFGQAGAVEDLTRDAIRNQFETNVFGLIELTNHIIPHMRANGRGRIINVSSILGIIAMPFRGAYNASKYALEGFTDTLRMELYDSPIFVSLIEPGPVESQFRNTAVDKSLKAIDMEKSVFKKQYENMLKTFKQNKKDSIFTKPPEAVVKKILHAIQAKNPKVHYPVTFPAHLFFVLKRLLTARQMDFVLRQISKKELSKD